MIIDIPGTNLELETHPDGAVELKKKHGLLGFILKQDELIKVAIALTRARIAHIPTTKGDAQ